MTTSLPAGRFDQRITLQRRVAGSAGFGQRAETWENLPTQPTVWAAVSPGAGRDFAAADQLQATLDAKFTIRWRADVTADMRVLWRGQPFEIIGQPVDVDGGRALLELRCTQGVRDGR